jgi:hypothetical protein
MMDDKIFSDETKAYIKAIWDEAVAAQPAPRIETPSEIAPVGTLVRVASIDPDWNYASCGHPVIGSIGIVSDHLCPEGKSSLTFGEGVDKKMHLTSGSYYDVEDDPITVFLPDTCLQVKE